MDDRFNTAAGWVLFAGIVALGSSIASGLYFHADNPESPEKMGYFIEGAEEGSDGGAPAYDLGTLLAAADPAAGEKLFAKCSTCHTYNQGGANGIGPNLWAVMGSPIGSHIPGYAYSAALKEKGGTWDYAAMDAWLKSPKAFAAGTKMSFAGLSKPEDRAALMAFMKANGGGPAFPAPKAADAAAPVDAAATPAGDATPGREGGANAPVPGAPVSDTAAAGGASADQPVPSTQSATRNSGDKPGEGS